MCRLLGSERFLRLESPMIKYSVSGAMSSVHVHLVPFLSGLCRKGTVRSVVLVVGRSVGADVLIGVLVDAGVVGVEAVEARAEFTGVDSKGGIGGSWVGVTSASTVSV